MEYVARGRPTERYTMQQRAGPRQISDDDDVYHQGSQFFSRCRQGVKVSLYCELSIAHRDSRYVYQCTRTLLKEALHPFC